MNRLNCLIITFGWAFASTISSADDGVITANLKKYRASVSPFVTKFCVDCHGPAKQKGDVRLDTIDADMVHGKSASLWKDVLHRLETGEMPPKKAVQPKQAERDAVTKWIRQEVRKHITAQQGVPGRVVLRRLSRNEYRNTMRDLLGLHYDIGRELPPDTTYHGFDHIAEVQELSRSQMKTYLQLARYTIDKAIVSGHRPLSFTYRAEPELDKDGLEWRVNSHGIAENLESAKKFTDEFRFGRGEKKMEPDQWAKTYRFGIRTAQGRFGDSKKYTTKTGIWLKAPQRAYEHKGGDWGRMGFRLPHIPHNDGLYRLRIKAGAKQQKGLGTPLLTVHVFKKLLGNFEITASADDPQWHEFVFAAKDLIDVQIHSDDNRFAKSPITDIVLNNGYENPGVRKGRRWAVPDEVELPGVFIDAVEFETDYVAKWPPASHHRILFDSPNRNELRKYAEEVLTQFMSRAFRRPVRSAELAGKMKLFDQAFAKTNDFITAIKEPLVATLVSPQFLFLAEDTAHDDSKRRNLDDYELASRLSYFLWSTMPDEVLLASAAKGELTKPSQLESQLERMLKDKKADAFHRGFMTQWLGLSKLDEIMIEDDRWVVRTGLRTSMRKEPVHFFAELLRSNLSVMNFIDSDFAMLNERMAQHYSIEGVYGNHFRKVSLKSEQQRGGLLTQAACLTITTDGMITSPIYRGKWVLETILDMPPPPAPANVPPLDDAPEVRHSLREQFAKHRENESCAACHNKIDPIGWPFERYSILGEYSDYGWGPNWTDFHDTKRNKKDLKPDLHGTLPGGTRVETVKDLQQAILKNNQKDVLRSVTRNLMIYALGRPLDVSDDDVVSEIIQKLEANGNRMRDLVKAIVLSKPFLEK